MKVLVLVQIAKFVLLCSLLAAGVIEAVWHLLMGTKVSEHHL